jgi:hypothetical protein
MPLRNPVRSDYGIHFDEEHIAHFTGRVLSRLLEPKHDVDGGVNAAVAHNVGAVGCQVSGLWAPVGSWDRSVRVKRFPHGNGRPGHRPLIGNRTLMAFVFVRVV